MLRLIKIMLQQVTDYKITCTTFPMFIPLHCQTMRIVKRAASHALPSSVDQSSSNTQRNKLCSAKRRIILGMPIREGCVNSVL